eukprot:gene2695-3114_t
MDVKNNVNINGESISVDPQLLFQRLITVADQMNENRSEIFKYELCSYPTSLFESTLLMREAHKATLADAIWATGQNEVAVETITKMCVHVLDGGSLLRRIPWPKRSTFLAICKVYIDFVTKKYTRAAVVFDGYQAGPSTKDNTHLRRSKGKIGAEVHFKEDMVLRTSKDEFLSNGVNKQHFINLLSGKLIAAGCNAVHAMGDADFLIVKTAIEEAKLHPVAVIGEDIDLLVLLCYHTDVEDHDIVFYSEAKRKSKKRRIWDIKQTKRAIGLDECRLLPVIHAVSGCDTTSRVFGIGKSVALKKRLDHNFCRFAEVFLNDHADESEIIFAREQMLLSLYNAKDADDLDTLRFQRFHEKVAYNTSAVQMQNLPPTSAAAGFHSKRVYLQVHYWIGHANEWQPESWGWFCENGKLIPKTIALPPAPQRLLQII